MTPEEDQAAGEDREVRAVLETSALLSYARGHVHVGELLIDIADEGVYMGLPSVALLDAHARLLRDGPARARLGVLVTLPGVAVLLLGDDEASAAAATVPQTDNDLARAHAVWAALKHGAYYLTSHPTWLRQSYPSIRSTTSRPTAPKDPGGFTGTPSIRPAWLRHLQSLGRRSSGGEPTDAKAHSPAAERQ